MRNYITEPDFFHHAPAERLIVDRIEIEGYHNQRTVLNIPITRLRPFTMYDVVIRQPIPQDARALPLFVKAIADTKFTPTVSTGFGRTDEVHGMRGETLDGQYPVDDWDCEFADDVEVIHEVVEAKMYKVTMFGYGNAAFANDLIFRNTEPYPFIRMYLNDENEFVILPYCAPRKHKCKRLVVNRQVVVREPIRTESLGIGRSVTEFVHPRKSESYATWVEGGCGCRHGHGERFGYGGYGSNRGF